MNTWNSTEEITLERPKGLGWVILFLRLFLIISVIVFLLFPLILCQLLRLKAAGQSVVKFACRLCLKIVGIRLMSIGKPMKHAGAVVSNHSSWLDIFTLNAVQKVYFVSKDDLEKWPVVGWVARVVGTVFIRRNRLDSYKQKNILLKRINAGDKLLFFPEGSTTDGRRVIPFKPTLFAAFFEQGSSKSIWIQPVSVNYIAPPMKRRDWYGWWGDMDFAASIMMILSHWKQGNVELIFHEPLDVRQFSDRKRLCYMAEKSVCSGLNLR